MRSVYIEVLEDYLVLSIEWVHIRAEPIRRLGLECKVHALVYMVPG